MLLFEVSIPNTWLRFIVKWSGPLGIYLMKFLNFRVIDMVHRLTCMCIFLTDMCIGKWKQFWWIWQKKVNLNEYGSFICVVWWMLSLKNDLHLISKFIEKYEKFLKG